MGLPRHLIIFQQKSYVYVKKNLRLRSLYAIHIFKLLNFSSKNTNIFPRLLGILFEAISSPNLFAQCHQWNHQNNERSLFKGSNMLLALPLNRFQTYFWCLHCWLWISKYRLGRRVVSWGVLRTVLSIQNLAFLRKERKAKNS